MAIRFFNDKAVVGFNFFLPTRFGFFKTVWKGLTDTKNRELYIFKAQTYLQLNRRNKNGKKCNKQIIT